MQLSMWDAGFDARAFLSGPLRTESVVVYQKGAIESLRCTMINGTVTPGAFRSNSALDDDEMTGQMRGCKCPAARRINGWEVYLHAL
jgi:hypothetical protein